MRIGTVACLTALAVALPLAAGCGDDDGDDSSPPTSEAADTNGGDGGSLGDTEVTALTDDEICTRLSGDDLGDALGFEVTEAAVGGSSTAQCAYSYASPTGGTSNVAVASLGSDVDLGGRSGDEAFDYVADINRGLAGGTDFEEVDVDAGDRAIRFSGEALHLGVLAVDGHLLTLLVPTPDAEADAVDQLLAVMADRFGT